MFKFFTNKKWHLWSIGGTILILAATWYQVQLDVRINGGLVSFMILCKKL